MGNDEKILAPIAADEIPWLTPHSDRLMLDDGERWLADSLRASMTCVASLTRRLDSASARILALRAEVKSAHNEIRSLRAQLAFHEDQAA